METVVVVMMILVCFNYILKQSYRKPYAVVMSAVCCALFVGLTWQFAIEQSRSRMTDWLADTTLMLDVAVVLTLEVLIQTLFCIFAARIQTSGKVKPVTLWIYRLLRWFTGVLIFPVLFSLLVTLIFAMPGVSFALLAWSLAAVVFIAIPIGTYMLRKLLPEKEIRLELLFLANVIIAILSVIATVNGQTAVAGVSDVDWWALSGVMLLVVTGLVGGALIYRIKQNKLLS